MLQADFIRESKEVESLNRSNLN